MELLERADNLRAERDLWIQEVEKTEEEPFGEGDKFNRENWVTYDEDCLKLASRIKELEECLKTQDPSSQVLNSERSMGSPSLSEQVELLIKENSTLKIELKSHHGNMKSTLTQGK